MEYKIETIEELPEIPARLETKVFYKKILNYMNENKNKNIKITLTNRRNALNVYEWLNKLKKNKKIEYEAKFKKDNNIFIIRNLKLNKRVELNDL